MSKRVYTDKYQRPVKGKNGKTHSITSVAAKARGKKATVVKKKVLATIDRRGKSTIAVRGLVYDDYRGTMTVNKSNKATADQRRSAKTYGKGKVKGKKDTYYTGGGF